MNRWRLAQSRDRNFTVAPDLPGDRAIAAGQARCYVLLAMLGVLAGCATHATRPSAPALTCSVVQVASEPCASRIAALQTAPADAQSWRFQGRAALVSGKQSGNARVEWLHAPASDVVVLSAPVTRQSWRLDVGRGGAVLRGMADGPRHGADAASLLRAATGWEIPVELMRDWVRGRPAPVDVAKVSVWRFNEVAGAPLAGLAGFDQAGWRIDILARDGEGRPTRFNAEAVQAEHRVRVVIDQWDTAAGE